MAFAIHAQLGVGLGAGARALRLQLAGNLGRNGLLINLDGAAVLDEERLAFLLAQRRQMSLFRRGGGL